MKYRKYLTEADVINIEPHIQKKKHLLQQKKIKAVVDATRDVQKSIANLHKVLRQNGFLIYVNMEVMAKDISAALARFLISFLQIMDR